MQTTSCYLLKITDSCSGFLRKIAHLFIQQRAPQQAIQIQINLTFFISLLFQNCMCQTNPFSDVHIQVPLIGKLAMRVTTATALHSTAPNGAAACTLTATPLNSSHSSTPLYETYVVNQRNLYVYICGMFKQNQSEVGQIQFSFF